MIHTLTSPRGRIARAAGTTTADARRFEPVATQSLEAWSLCSAPFQEHAFCTAEFRIAVTFDEDGTWGYQ